MKTHTIDGYEQPVYNFTFTCFFCVVLLANIDFLRSASCVRSHVKRGRPALSLRAIPAMTMVGLPTKQLTMWPQTQNLQRPKRSPGADPASRVHPKYHPLLNKIKHSPIPTHRVKGLRRKMQRSQTRQMRGQTNP